LLTNETYWLATIEQNRKLELRYGADFAIEERPKTA